MKFIHPIEPNLHFVPSLLSNERRLRAVANEIWSGSPNSTFFEFIEDYAISLIGDPWWIEQEEETAKNEQNVMFRFADYYQRHKHQIFLKSKETGEPPLIHPSGPILFWLTLCYDLVCLKHKFSLPEPLKLIERLRCRGGFQGTRYEIAMAASLVRAGCNVNWINPKNAISGLKTCELIATHRLTGISFAVEAKSKHRDGILNQKGIFDTKAEHNRISRLLIDALKKDSQNLPLVIFIDLNLPFYSDDNSKTNSLRQIEEAVNERRRLLSTNKHLALIVFTNFPFHYGKAEDAPPLTNHCFAMPKEIQSLPEKIKKDIEDSLLKYGHLPREI
jgi:hypothetical protein